MNVTDEPLNSQHKEQLEEQTSEQAEASDTPEVPAQQEESLRGESIPEGSAADDQAASPDTDEKTGTGQAADTTARAKQDDRVLRSTDEVGGEQDVCAPASADELPSEGEAPSEGEVPEQGGRFRIDTIQANTVNVFGQASIETARKATDTDKLPLVDPKPDMWHKVKAVFVPSREYEDIRERGFGTHEERVFIRLYRRLLAHP